MKFYATVKYTSEISDKPNINYIDGVIFKKAFRAHNLLCNALNYLLNETLPSSDRVF